MTTMHLSSALFGWRDRCTQAALTLLAAGSCIAGGEALADEPITAVYRPQEISFQYRSANQFYSCSDLQQRIAIILVAVGARDDINVTVRNCSGNRIPEDIALDTRTRRDSSMDRWDDRRPSATFRNPNDGYEQSAHILIRLRMPVELTAKVEADLEKDKARRELLSKVTGNLGAAFDDTASFPAQREEVTLSQSTLRLRPEDCDVLEQVSSQVFRKVGVRVVRKSLSCGPRQMSRIPPTLTAEALFPAATTLRAPTLEKEEPAASENSAPAKTEPAAQTPPP